MKYVLERIKNTGLSKPHQERQERWQEPGWASRTRWCLSGRLAHSGTRCDRAAGLVSGSLGKSRWQGYPPRFIKQIHPAMSNILTNGWMKREKKRTGSTVNSSCTYTHRSDETAICGSWKYLFFQSHIPTAEIPTWNWANTLQGQTQYRPIVTSLFYQLQLSG